MASWRDQILREFTPGISKLTLVADPDGLLLEERILEELGKQGFELIPFNDHVAFRYVYESKFRSRWDRGEDTQLSVILRFASQDLDALPYDLLQAGRKLCFSLSHLFPNFSYPVVAALELTYLDALYEAQSKYAPGELGDNATKDFILRHVFEIAPELIKEPKDLLRVLLRRHYRGQQIPPILDERLIQLLQQKNIFHDWPLDRIVPDGEAFFAFLQERWPVFLDFFASKKSSLDAEHNKHKGFEVYEKGKDYNFKFSGPEFLPFDHDDIRIYMDNLFLEGLLQPIPYEPSEVIQKSWVRYGIKNFSEEHRYQRIEGLLNSVENSIPSMDARYLEWMHFAYRWAKLRVLSFEEWILTEEGKKNRERITKITNEIDTRFFQWVKKHFGSLINLPATNPVMLHHLPRFFAHSLFTNQFSSSQHPSKLAFLMVDGLAMHQWIELRDVLMKMEPDLRFRESAVFAWIPTITSVCRQAAFAGKLPLYFPESINSTQKEPILWKQFWVDQGLKINEVAYLKGLGQGDLDEVFKLIKDPRLRVLGLVIDKIDRIMHGMELGEAGMQNQVRQWARQGYLRKLIVLLHSEGFQIYLASDHGNIEARGIGRSAEGAIADLRGQRVRIYPDFRLRAKIKAQFPESIEWPPIGIPEDYLPLLAPTRSAFVQKDEIVVSHGGISIEEVIVPFIQIHNPKFQK